jgi:hypothetical protein
MGLLHYTKNVYSCVNKYVRQRLLRPLAVVNPYAEHLTFLDDRTRTRRDHAKYLTLIESITLLHQHQRAVRTAQSGGKAVEYIEVTLDDIELANRLAHEVLGRSLDELPPQTRRVLGLIESLVAERSAQQSLRASDVRFTRRELRARGGMSDAAIRVHLERLVSLEYIRSAIGRNGQRFEYELLFDGDLQRSGPQLIGLIDVTTMRTSQGKAATSQGSESDLAPALQAACAHLVPCLQDAQSAINPYEYSDYGDVGPLGVKNARTGMDLANGHDRSPTVIAPARRSLNPLAANAVTAGA